MRAKLDTNVSLYLDLSRIAAALIVLLHHVFQPPFVAHATQIPGRSAVIVFFVISGFVIAYASDGQADWRPYAVSRLARVYSVAIPALAMTGLLFWLSAKLWSPVDTLESYDRPVLRLLASAIFINHLWNLTISALSNGPYWSLCYEVWYYVLFGIAKYGRGHARWIVICAIVLALGPRILLLMPIWALGVGLYFAMKSRRQRHWRLSRAPFLAWAMAFVLALLVYNPADAVSALVEQSLHDGYLQAGPARWFIGGDWRFPSDYLLAVLFASTVWFSGASFAAGAPACWYGYAIRKASSYTFSLYLYHAPLLIFLYHAVKSSVAAGWLPWVMLGVTIACVWALGGLTEHRKAPYTRVFGRLLSMQGASHA